MARYTVHLPAIAYDARDALPATFFDGSERASGDRVGTSSLLIPPFRCVAVGFSQFGEPASARQTKLFNEVPSREA